MSTPLPHSRARVQRIAEAAVERARLTVVPRVRARAPRVPFVTLVSLLLLGGVVGLLMFNTSMQQSAFAATALEQQAADLSSREQTLQMELEVLRDPQVVAEKARALGMVDGGPPAFLKTDGTVSGVPVPATLENRVDILPPPVRKPKALDPDPIVIKKTREARNATDRTSGNRANGNRTNGNRANVNRTNTGDTDRASRRDGERRDRNGSTRPDSGDRSTR
jgi:cell division protein FtsB